MTNNEYNPDVVSPPGDTLLESVLVYLIQDDNLVAQIEDIIKNQAPITETIAEKLSDVLSVPRSFWLNRQKTYDEYIARSKR